MTNESPLPASARTVTRYRVTDNGEGGFNVAPCEGSPDNTPYLTDGTEVVRFDQVASLLTALAEQEQEMTRLRTTAQTLAADVREIGRIRYDATTNGLRLEMVAEQLDALAAERPA